MSPAEMAALHTRCFETPRPWRTDEFERLCGQFATRTHVNENGFLLGRLLLEEAEILTLAVDPDHRRTGIARGLLDQFLSSAAASGAKSAFLDVLHDNEPAKSLYRTTGFEQLHRRKNYFRSPDGRLHDGLVFHRSLH